MKSKYQFGILAAVCVTVLLAGCPTLGPGEPTFIGFNGNFSTDNGTFHMDGEIRATWEEHGPYDDVRVYLYSDNGTLIKKEEVGELDDSISVNITEERIPKYVILDSDDFYQGQNVVVDYFERTQHRNRTVYAQRSVVNRSQYPVTLPDETG